MSKKKKEEIQLADNKVQRIIYTDPIFNEKTKLFEIRKEDESKNLLDLIVDSDKEELLKKREELIKQYIMSQIHKPKTKQEEYFTKEGLRNRAHKKDKGNNQDEIINTIVSRKLSGESITTIVHEVSKEYNVSHTHIGLKLSEAMDLIKKRAQGIMDEVLESHIDRYESLYEWFKDNGFLKHAVKSLKAKEALLGVGQDLMSVNITNRFEISPMDEGKYMFERLDEKGKKDLKALVGRLSLTQKNIGNDKSAQL